MSLPSWGKQLRQAAADSACHCGGLLLMGNLQLLDIPGQDWADMSPCSTLISLDFLSAQIRAVLLSGSHLAISGDCSEDCGGVRGPCNISYTRIQVINKHWSPVKKKEREELFYTHVTLEVKHWVINTDAAACVQGQLQKWEMGYFSTSDNSYHLSQRQSKGQYQLKWVEIGPAVMRRKSVSFFPKAFWKLPPNTQRKMESFWLIIIWEKVIFPLWASDNTEYYSGICNRKY